MKKQLRLLMAGIVLSVLSACDSSKGAGPKTGESTTFPRNETLYIVGHQWGDPNSFNPLNHWPAWPVRSEFNVMYETLLSYNSLTGELEPLLGTLVERTTEYVSVEVNPTAKWSDGTPVTAEDVKFTFSLGLNYGESPITYVRGFLSEVTIDTISSTIDTLDLEIVQEEEKRVIVTFHVDQENRNNPLSVVDFLYYIPILPKHIFEEKLKTNNNNFSAVQQEIMGHPQVISGPYNLHRYTNELIVIRRRDDYWGNDALFDGRKPAPRYIIHPIYKNNAHASTDLKNGNLDISSNYMPRIWLKNNRGVQTWYEELPYYVPGSIPQFIINVTRGALSDRNLRRAMAHAIDYERIQRLAVSGYTPDIQSGLILPFGEEAKYFVKEDVEKYGATRFDIEEAKRILAEAGYTSVFNNRGDLDHMLDSNGDRVPRIEITSPSGWSDFEAIIRLAVHSMRSAGIDVRAKFVDASLYWQAMPTGDFDLLMHTPSPKLSPSMPWSRFETILSATNWHPEGERMFENLGRFNNPECTSYIPAVDSLLRAIPLITSEEELAQAYRTLNKIYMQEQPTLPLLYRPEEFFQFSNLVWTNFPTKQNPYAPPHMPTSGAGRAILWEIHLAQEEN